MNQDYWQRQTSKPLFPDLIWSRPETKHGSGKLLIIGGQAQEFSNVADVYNLAERAGAGIIRVIMPDSTKKFTNFLPNIEYGTSNQSGSFAKNALPELLDASNWSDAVLLAGNLGKNSETSLMLENFIFRTTSQIIINDDSLQSIATISKDLLKRENTSLIINFNSLQKIANELGLTEPITSTMSNPDLAKSLHRLTQDYPVELTVTKDDEVWNAYNGLIALTNIPDVNTTKLTAETSVWVMQNPTKKFNSITTAVWQTKETK